MCGKSVSKLSVRNCDWLKAVQRERAELNAFASTLKGILRTVGGAGVGGRSSRAVQHLLLRL